MKAGEKFKIQQITFKNVHDRTITSVTTHSNIICKDFQKPGGRINVVRDAFVQNSNTITGLIAGVDGD